MTDTEIAGTSVAAIHSDASIEAIVPQNLTEVMQIASTFSEAGMYLAGTDRFTPEKRQSMLTIGIMKALSIHKDPTWALE